MVDVAVVGGELCGLAAAALLSLGGKKVVVIDDGEVVARPLGDRLAPLAPSLWKLPAAGPAAGLFDALALKADARRMLGEPLGLGVVDDPDLRCVLPGNDDALVRELSRCFGAERGRGLQKSLAAVDVARRHAVFTELASLHEDGIFFEARRARGRVKALGKAADIDGADDGCVALRGDGSGLWPVLEQLRPFVQSRAGSTAPADGEAGLAAVVAASVVVGGIPAGGALGPRAVLRELLMGFVRHHKGDVVHERVDSVDVEGKRVTGLRMVNKKADEIVATVVIDATAGRDFSDRLPASKLREKLLAQQGRVVVGGKTTSVRWLLPVRVLPRGMPPLLLLLGQAPHPPVLIGLSGGAPLGDAGKGSHLDEQLLCLVATAPTDDAGFIEERLTALLPFAREHVRTRDVVDASGVHGSLVVKDSEHPLGGRRPRTAWKNLVRAGRDLAPAFGIDGELVAARSVVAVVEQSLPKPKR